MKFILSWINQLVKEQKNAWALLPLIIAYVLLASPLPYINEVIRLASMQTDLSKRVVGVSSFIVISMLCSFSVLIFAFSRKIKNYVIFFILLSLVIVDLSYTDIVGHYFTISDLIFSYNESGQSINALIEFFPTWSVAALKVLPFAIALFILRRWVTIEFSCGITKYIILLVAAAAVWSSMVFSNGKRDNYVTAPRLLGVAAYAVHYSDYLGASLPYAQRTLDQSIRPTGEKMAKNIVLIIDESICSKYLSINGYRAETTPFLDSIKDTYINLGDVASAANASNTSNYILRNGLTPQNIPDDRRATLNWPSLLTYAKQAGMHTIYIDSQHNSDSLQNYMSNFDLRDIDYYENIITDDGNIAEADFKAMRQTASILNKSKGNFIILLKMGMHFPYYLRYSESEKIFTPDYDKSNAMLYRAKIKNTQEDRERHLNSYLNGISKVTDSYLKHMLSTFDMSDTLIIYTADHGQSINVENQKNTHNTWPHPSAEQNLVPVLIFGAAAQQIAPGQISKNKYSQLQIFPTLLSVMGYPAEVFSKYGQPLASGPTEQASFAGPLFSKEGKFEPVRPDEAYVAEPDGKFASSHTKTQH